MVGWCCALLWFPSFAVCLLPHYVNHVTRSVPYVRPICTLPPCCMKFFSALMSLSGWMCVALSGESQALAHKLRSLWRHKWPLFAEGEFAECKLETSPKFWGKLSMHAQQESARFLSGFPLLVLSKVFSFFLSHRLDITFNWISCAWGPGFCVGIMDLIVFCCFFKKKHTNSAFKETT